MNINMNKLAARLNRYRTDLCDMRANPDRIQGFDSAIRAVADELQVQQPESFKYGKFIAACGVEA
jgi:hypothetical protein